MEGWIAAVLLVAALALFWISTGQFALWRRGALIAAGAAAVGGAAWRISRPSATDQIPLIQDLLANPGSSLIWMALSGNAGTIVAASAQVLGFLAS